MLLELRCAWCEERVYFYDDTGRLRRLAAAWTDVVVPSPFETVSAGRSHFRTDDLLHLVGLLARLEEANVTVNGRQRKRKLSSK